jgi:hypothetical protein
MNRIYEQPAVEIVEFSTTDVITTSGGGAAILPDDEF